MIDLDAVIEALVAYCKLHVPTEDSYGRTCDERGCRICNGTSFTRTAQDWIDSGDPLPFDPDDGAEMSALVAEASEIA